MGAAPGQAGFEPRARSSVRWAFFMVRCRFGSGSTPWRSSGQASIRYPALLRNIVTRAALCPSRWMKGLQSGW
jgi:hypothetical protein